jgi:acetyl-CoA carboxylase biotin carboxylase subunit
MIAALEALVCEGVPTTIPIHLAILRSPALAEGRYDTRTVQGWPG